MFPSLLREFFHNFASFDTDDIKSVDKKLQKIKVSIKMST